MAYAHSEPTIESVPPVTPIPVKIVVAGGFGVGKTALVGAISEIEPLTTEAAMTDKSLGVDDTTHISTKSTTTVAMDFGRITIEQNLILYLFGTPGQERFGFMWDDLSIGALGAVVLADTRRLEDVFPALDYFERLGLPFVVAVNRFDGFQPHSVSEVRSALDVDGAVPIVECDARSRDSVKIVVLTLLDVVLQRATARSRG